MTKTNPDNRIQENYDEKFNGVKDNYDSSTAGLSPEDLEKLENYANTGDEEKRGGDKASDIEKARQKEESGGWANNYTGGKQQSTGTFKSAVKKKGPIGLIMALLGIGGVSLISIPSLLPMQLRSAAENFYGNVSRSTTYHYKQTLRYRIGNTAACNSNPTGIRCKMATVNDKTLKKYNENGFKTETKQVGDRHVITSVTFPDGTTVTDGDAFVRHMDSSVDARGKVFGVFNPRSGPYSGRSFSQKVLNKFGLSKAAVKLSSKDREAMARSFNREVGGPQTDEDADNHRRQIESDAKAKVSDTAGKATNVVGLGCTVYNTTRLTLAMVKFKNGVKYAAFGWLFLKLADQIRAGDADEGTIAAAATVLTAVAASGENKGKTAMDSAGVKAMMYGDRAGLSNKAQSILLSGNPALIKLDNTLADIKDMFGGKSMHSICKATEDPAVGALLTAAMCAGGGATGGSILPGLGTAIGGAAGGIACTAINLALSIVGGIVAGEILERIMPIIIDYLSGKPLNFDLPPEDAGNAITIGAGIILGSAGLAKGMKLGTKDEVNNFHKVAYQADKEYIEVARNEAKDTPFDITNQYSFMGQLASNINLTGGNALTASFAAMSSILTNAQPAFASSVVGAADMPSPVKSTTLTKCADPELAAQNIACDIAGQPQTVQSLEEMSRPQKENLDYMIENDYVNEEGAPNEDKDYAKFLKYCTTESETLPGTSDLSISDDDFDWPDKRCSENNEMMSNFRTYTSRVGQLEDEDTQYEGGGGGGAQQDGGGAAEGEDIAGDDYKSECKDYTTCTRQCVDFVLFRLMKHGVLKNRVALGNGKDVVGTLGRMGYKVNTTPAVHAVMSTPVTSTPQWGHTAMVSKVNADGSFVVEEYNFASPLKYGTRTIPASDIKAKKITFAHTEVDYK